MNKQSPKFKSLSSKERLEVIKKIDEAAFKDNSDQSWFK